MGCVVIAPAALLPGMTLYPMYMRLGGPWGGLDWCGKLRTNRDAMPGSSGLYKIVIPTTLSRPTVCRIMLPENSVCVGGLQIATHFPTTVKQSILLIDLVLIQSSRS